MTKEQRRREYYLRNKERWKKYRAAWRAGNKECLAAQRRRYKRRKKDARLAAGLSANDEKTLLCKRRWRQRHLDEAREMTRSWKIREKLKQYPEELHELVETLYMFNSKRRKEALAASGR